MLNLQILQSPNLVPLFPFHLLLGLDELFHGFDKYFLTKKVFKQQGLAKWQTAVVFTLMNAYWPWMHKKRCFQ